MARTVFILGAGASAEGGCPCMGDFLERARGLAMSGSHPELSQAFEALEEFRRFLQRGLTKSQFNLDNIEDIFSCLEMYLSVNGPIDGFNCPPDEIRRYFIELITRTLQSTQRYHMIEYDEIGAKIAVSPDGYSEFCDLVQMLKAKCGHDVSVITFNYDMGLDFCLSRGSMEVDYGFAEFEKTIDQKDQIELFKLHGSLGWLLKDTESGLQEIKAVNLNTLHSYGQPLGNLQRGRAIPCRLDIIRAFSDLAREEGLDRATPLIVPPTDAKVVAREKMREIWARAFRALAEAENIFVIGYSLPESDLFFRKFFSVAMTSDTIPRRFWIFDKYGGIFSRYKSLIGPAFLRSSEIYKELEVSMKDASVLLKKEADRAGEAF